MTTEAQKRASRKWDDNNRKRVFINLHTTIDADILQHLETVGNKQGYIKELIRKDMKQK